MADKGVPFDLDCFEPELEEKLKDAIRDVILFASDADPRL
jgi:hypothetical protein